MLYLGQIRPRPLGTSRRTRKILAPEAGTLYPRCTAGKRACPPEGCGGIWGYANFLQAIADPEHPDHEELLDWVGEAFEPEYFDLADANTLLQRLPKPAAPTGYSSPP